MNLEVAIAGFTALFCFYYLVTGLIDGIMRLGPRYNRRRDPMHYWLFIVGLSALAAVCISIIWSGF